MTSEEASILDHPIIGGRYFFPRPTPVSDPLWVDAGDVRLACHLQRCGASGAPTLVHFHGNGEVVADYEGSPFARMLGAEGLDVLFAEYRGYGGSGGRPALARMLADTAAIGAAIGKPPGDIVVYGRSVGTIFALEFARRFPGIRGLVIESGVADPLERLLLRMHPRELGVTLEALQQESARLADHRAKLAAITAPFLVVHARHDTLVPVDNAERMASWAGGPVHRHIVTPGDHNTILAYHEREIAALVGRLARGEL